MTELVNISRLDDIGKMYVTINENFDEVLKLKGQMLFVQEWDSIIFLATPVLVSLLSY